MAIRTKADARAEVRRFWKDNIRSQSTDEDIILQQKQYSDEELEFLDAVWESEVNRIASEIRVFPDRKRRSTIRPTPAPDHANG